MGGIVAIGCEIVVAGLILLGVQVRPLAVVLALAGGLLGLSAAGVGRLALWRHS